MAVNENIKHLRQICEHNLPAYTTRCEAEVVLDLLEAEVVGLIDAIERERNRSGRLARLASFEADGIIGMGIDHEYIVFECNNCGQRHRKTRTEYEVLSRMVAERNWR